MGKRSDFERIPRDFYPTPAAAVLPLIPHLLGIRGETIELCINHRSGARGGVAGIYNRSTLLFERKEAFERWASHVEGLVSGDLARTRGRE